MIEIKRKENCCGCGACAAACPKDAIVLTEDQEGFQYPNIDTAKCVDCGLCEKVCPFIEKMEGNAAHMDSYAMYVNSRDNRLISSSGGVFGAIAMEILEEGGAVCGAAFDDGMMVKHIVIENADELNQLRGSKYLQSDNNGVFQKVKELLENNRNVLYSGTACQVAGLKKFLKKEYENLFTIDVLCHGVPSPKLWKKYIQELQDANQSKVSKINFRNKDTGWKTYSFTAEFADGTIKKERYENNEYMRLFLGNICLRPSCHQCNYKDLGRPSDITMGDYWGIEEQLPEMDDDLGTSVVKVNSKKGEEMIRRIQSRVTYQAVDIETALPAFADARKSVSMHENRKKFFSQLDKKNINQLLELLKPSFKTKMKNKVKKGKNKLKRIVKKAYRG